MIYNPNNFLQSVDVYLRVKDFIRTEDIRTKEDEDLYYSLINRKIKHYNGDIYFRLDDSIDAITRNGVRYDSTIYAFYLIEVKL